MRNRVDGRWDVAVVALLAGTFASATNRSIGWFYVAYMDDFNVDRQTASWPGCVLLAVFLGGGLLVAVLHRHMSLYRISLLGSCLLWGGMGASVFAPNIAWMTFSVGFLHGLGCGMVLISHMVLIMQYFKKYRGVATGLRLTANPLSAIVFPPVLSALGDSYGFRGGLLIYTGIIMHVTALALFLKEPPWLQPGKAKESETGSSKRNEESDSTDSAGCESALLSKTDEPGGVACSMHMVVEETRKRSPSVLEAEALIQTSIYDLNGTNTESTEADVPLPKDEMCIEASDSNALGKREDVKISVGNENTSGCLPSKEQLLPLVENKAKILEMTSPRCREYNAKNDLLLPVSEQFNETVRNNRTVPFGCPRTKPKASRTQWVHRRLLRALPSTTPLPSFATIVLGSMILDYANSVHLFTMVDYARDKGVPRNHAAMTLSYTAGPEIAGRVFLPLLADLGWVSRPVMACGNLFTLGLLFVVTPESSGAMYVVLRSLSSVSGAALLTMKHVLIADYLGSEAVSVVSGVSGLLLLPIIFCNPLVFGYFRDTMGSYDNLYRISGGILLCTSLIVFGRLLFFRNTKKKVTEPITGEK